MNRQKKIFVGKSLAVLSIIPVLIFAYAGGPDPGKSGVAGESTCNEAGCHVGTALNAGGGSVQISTEGTTYTPGVTQRISVKISDRSQRRWGFQLTARLADNPKTRAGILKSIDSSTSVICAASNLREATCSASPALQYIQHSQQGSITTAVGAGNTFSFDWTPPDTAVGDIILYAAGNAANGNLDDSGDHIYTTTLRLSPAAATGASPAISEVLHDGDFKPNISANGWVVIKGTDLASTTRVWEDKDFVGNQLPTSLDGTSVKVNGKDAFVYYISPTQVNVLAPVDAGVGPANVEVIRNNSASDSETTTIQNVTPAFFHFSGIKYIASRHEDYSYNGPADVYPGLTTPAKPGELILLFGSGFGPTTPAPVNGQLLSGAPRLASSYSITIGGVDVTNAPGTFAGLSATGLYQFNVRVPDSMPNGDAAVVVTVDGVSSQTGAYIFVQR